MSAHFNRSRAAGPASNPTPGQVRAAREAVGHTQTEAARTVWSTLRSWQAWEDAGANGRRMPPAAWHLYLLRISQHPTCKLTGDLAG